MVSNVPSCCVTGHKTVGCIHEEEFKLMYPASAVVLPDVLPDHLPIILPTLLEEKSYQYLLLDVAL